MGLIQKIFGTYSQRELKSIYPIADKIEALEEEYRALTDEQLQAKTPECKQRLQQLGQRRPGRVQRQRQNDIIGHRDLLRPAHTVPCPGQRPGRCRLPGVAAPHRKLLPSFHCKAPSPYPQCAILCAARLRGAKKARQTLVQHPPSLAYSIIEPGTSQRPQLSPLQWSQSSSSLPTMGSGSMP